MREIISAISAISARPLLLARRLYSAQIAQIAQKFSCRAAINNLLTSISADARNLFLRFLRYLRDNITRAEGFIARRNRGNRRNYDLRCLRYLRDNNI